MPWKSSSWNDKWIRACGTFPSQAKTTKVNPKQILAKIENYSNIIFEIEPLIPTPRLAKYYAPSILIDLGRIRGIIDTNPQQRSTTTPSHLHASSLRIQQSQKNPSTTPNQTAKT